MGVAITREVVVPANGILELKDLGLPVGTHLRVVVEVEETLPRFGSIREAFGAAKGLYSSAEEVDQELKVLRAEWDHRG